MADDQSVHPAPPNRLAPMNGDARDEFARIAAAAPGSPMIESAFLRSKVHMLGTNPLMSLEERRAASAAFSGSVPTALAPEEPGPAPGGVGYGAFYSPAFKTNFFTGTSISWEIICPNPPAGNVDNWLYLTATNRSAKGVEAFVAYHGQDDTSFNVFDWARGDNDRLRPPIPFASLTPYLGTETVNGVPFQVLPVQNTTFESADGQWVNQVWLLNIAGNQWTLVYQFEYPATLAEQTAGWVGTWGPIVETFQNSYAGTKPMGAIKTQLLSRDRNGLWNQWTSLGLGDSDIRVDNNGLSPIFLDANHTWAVQS